MSRSAESRKLLREMHAQTKAARQQSIQQTQYASSQNIHLCNQSGAPPPPPPPLPPPAEGVDEGAKDGWIKQDSAGAGAGPLARRELVPTNPNMGSTFNLNTMLYQNILKSDYYKALDVQLTTYHDVIGEIKDRVNHIEPWQPGGRGLPSTAFCLLLKLLTMRLTYRQMKQLLVSYGHPLLRAMGFLYLRYACVPMHLYKWFEPFLEDMEVFWPAHGPGGIHAHAATAPSAASTGTGDDKERERESMTIGQFVTRLLVDMGYYGTPLPRIPTALERKIKVLLSLIVDRRKRRQMNLKILSEGAEGEGEGDIFGEGKKIHVVWIDYNQGPMWRMATVGGPVEDTDDDNDHENDNVGVGAEGRVARQGHLPRYWVTFDGHDEPCTVDLGDMAVLQEKEPEQEPHKKRSRPLE